MNFRDIEKRFLKNGDIKKQFKLLNKDISFSWKRPEGWGLFGGGWNIKFGIMVGGSTTIINLIFCSFRISRQ